jgi:hypothetical protein
VFAVWEGCLGFGGFVLLFSVSCIFERLCLLEREREREREKEK